MCEPNEEIKETCMREFMEEATNSLGLNESERKQNEDHLKPFFEQGQEVIKIKFYTFEFTILFKINNVPIDLL